MNIEITSKPEKDYLLITTSGSIENDEEHRMMTERFFYEIKKHGAGRAIVTVSEIDFPGSLELHSKIVNFYKDELPEELASWQIAVVDESDYREVGYFWEFLANAHGFIGFKVFASMDDARTYMDNGICQPDS